MKIKKKNIQKWCEALDSGKYKQSKGQLQHNNRYCCLGVACKIFIPKDRLQIQLNGVIMIGVTPICQTFSPKWLKKYR